MGGCRGGKAGQESLAGLQPSGRHTSYSAHMQVAWVALMISCPVKIRPQLRTAQAELGSDWSQQVHAFEVWAVPGQAAVALTASVCVEDAACPNAGPRAQHQLGLTSTP